MGNAIPYELFIKDEEAVSDDDEEVTANAVDEEDSESNDEE